MKKLPTLEYEYEATESGYELVIGIDEVGRGALAGPVVAGAVGVLPLRPPLVSSAALTGSKSRVGLPSLLRNPSRRYPREDIDRINWERLGIDDSKRLTAKKREELAKVIKKYGSWAVGEASVTTINRVGIVKATEKAMRKAIKSLSEKSKSKKTYLLLDAFYVKHVKNIGLKNQKALVKGDQKSISIAAASIIAKVHRDELLTKLSQKLTLSQSEGSHADKYDWGKNKGYGTKKHLAAIKKYGVTKLHRKKFVRSVIASD